MTGLLAVSDSGPLIAYAAIARLDLIRAVLGTVSIPDVVAKEIRPSIPEIPEWIVILPRPPTSSVELRPSLDAGERAAIELAVAAGAGLVVIDDLAGRSAANRVGLTVVGSVGIAVTAKLRGTIPAGRPIIDALRATGLYLSDAVYEEALAAIDE